LSEKKKGKKKTENGGGGERSSGNGGLDAGDFLLPMMQVSKEIRTGKSESAPEVELRISCIKELSEKGPRTVKAASKLTGREKKQSYRNKMTRRDYDRHII